MRSRGGLNEVLEVRTGQKVSQEHKLAVVLIFHIDDAVPVLAASHLLAIDDHSPLTSHDSKGDQILVGCNLGQLPIRQGGKVVAPRVTYPDPIVELSLVLLVLLIVKGIETNVVVLHLGADPLLEQIPLLERQTVALGNHGHHIDNVRQLLHNSHVNWSKTMSGSVSEQVSSKEIFR